MVSLYMALVRYESLRQEECMSNELVKVTVNISEDLAEFTEKIAKKKNINKTTVINQALANEKFLQEVQNSGRKIFVENEAGEKVQVIFR